MRRVLTLAILITLAPSIFRVLRADAACGLNWAKEAPFFVYSGGCPWFTGNVTEISVYQNIKRPDQPLYIFRTSPTTCCVQGHLVFRF